MENINDLHEFIRLIANKVINGYLSPAQINRAVRHAELQLFKERVGLPEDYQPGRPVPRIAYALTQKISDDMAQFVAEASFTPTPENTTLAKPGDWLHPIPGALRGTYQPQPGWDEPATPLPALRTCAIDLVEQAELTTRLTSSLTPPSAEFPIAVVKAAALAFYPVGQLKSVTVPYLRLPVFSQWVGSDNGSGRLVYDHSSSVQTEWPKDTWNDLATRSLAYLGIHLQAPQVQQFAQLNKQQG